jgi:hypothetical protein
MGAYSNPQAIVDTQTGEHFKNLQATIAGTVANVAQNYSIRQKEIQKKLEENQKRIEATNKDIEEFEFSLMTSVNKIEAGDGTIDIAKTFTPLIDKAVQLRTGLITNTIKGEDRQKAMQQLANIQSTISGNFSKSLASLSVKAEDVMNARLKPAFEPGGLAADMKENDIRAFSVLTGKLKGRKEAVYENGDPDKLVWKIYEGENPEPIASYSASMLEKLDNTDNDIVKIVPDRTANNEALKVNNRQVFEAVPVNPKDPDAGYQSTGRLTDNFLMKKADGTLYTEKVYIKGTNTYKLVTKPNYASIKTTLNDQMDAQLAGVTDLELMLHINNTVNSYRIKANLDPLCFDSDKPLSKEEKAEAIEAYKDHFVKTQVSPTQDILKEDSSVLLQEDPKPEKPGKVEDKKEKEKDLSQQQQFLQNVFETPIAERNKLGVGWGTTVTGAEKTYKIAGPTDTTGKLGYWYLVKEGEVVGNPVSEETVKLQIGYKKK